MIRLFEDGEGLIASRIPRRDLLGIPPFAVLASKDYNKSKSDPTGELAERYQNELEIIHQGYFPGSDYMDIANEKKRIQQITADLGLGKSYKISKELQACIKLYKKHASFGAVESVALARSALDKMVNTVVKFSEQLDEMVNEAIDNGEINDIKTLMDIVDKTASLSSRIPEKVEALTKAERELRKNATKIQAQGEADISYWEIDEDAKESRSTIQRKASGDSLTIESGE